MSNMRTKQVNIIQELKTLNYNLKQIRKGLKQILLLLMQEGVVTIDLPNSLANQLNKPYKPSYFG